MIYGIRQLLIDYYKILEIPETASAEQIKKSFRRLALMYHPDRNDSSDATKKFVQINEAYVFLKDQNRRKLYRGNKASYYKKKEDVYKEWVRKERGKVRYQAQKDATSSYEEFENKFIAKAAGCASKLFNLFMVFLGLVMIFTSWLTVIYPDEEKGVSYAFVISMNVIGLVFLYGARRFTIAERSQK